MANITNTSIVCQEYIYLYWKGVGWHAGVVNVLVVYDLYDQSIGSVWANVKKGLQSKIIHLVCGMWADA